MYRIFKSSGQVTDRIDQFSDAQYLSADGDAAREVADALGVAEGTITVEHVATAPPVVVTIPPSAAPPVALSVDAKVDAILTALTVSKVLDADDKAALEALKA